MIKYTTFKQVKVRYSDTGKGRTIVLLHGFLESIEVWDEFVKKLSKRYRVICIDLPGHGQTPSIGYVHTMELMAWCVKTVLEKLKLRKYILVGHSMGGYTALAFAELFPENVKALCLFHSTAKEDTPEKKADRKRAIVAIKKNHRSYVNEFVVKWVADENRKRLAKEINEIKQLAIKTSPQSIVAWQEGMIARPDRQHVLKAAKFPVLFIAGMQDHIIPIETLMPQIELTKNVQTLFLEHAAHIGFLEEPEACAKAILKLAGKAFR